VKSLRARLHRLKSKDQSTKSLLIADVDALAIQVKTQVWQSRICFLVTLQLTHERPQTTRK
jgi:hypothetical protein